MPSLVKICGITHPDDAKVCEALGANFLGFIFAKNSKRTITPAVAEKIISQLTHGKAVGVFVEQSVTEIEALAKDLNLYAVQVYSAHSFNALTCRIIRSIRIAGPCDLQLIADFRNAFPDDLILLDAYHPQQMGGSGHSFDWNLLPQDLGNCFLSGGINPDNVARALSYQPYAIDLSSGVEHSPGRKDHAKLKQLFARIHHAQP